MPGATPGAPALPNADAPRAPRTPAAVRRRRRLPGAVRASALIALGTLVVAAHARLGVHAFDDAYIHLRIARHLADSGVPVFEAGERVLATSSLVWTLLLAGLLRIGDLAGLARDEAAVRAVAALDGAIALAAALIWARLLRRVAPSSQPLHCGEQALFAAVAFALLLPSSAGGMETPLALLVLGLAALGLARGRSGAAALLGVAPFVRPELAVFSALAVLDGIGRGAALRRAVAIALAAAPLAALELLWFGTLVPHALVAKTVVYDVRISDQLLLLGEQLRRLAALPARPAIVAAAAVAFAALGAAALGAAWRAAKRMPAAQRSTLRLPLGLGAGGAAVLAAYLTAGGLVFTWYVPLFALPLAFAVYALALHAGRTLRVGAALLLGLPAGAGIGLHAAAAAGDPAASPWFRENARARQLLAIGRAIALRYPGATVMAPEIGALGWGYPGRVVDALGLVSPAALPHHPLRVPEERQRGFVGAVPPTFVAAAHPDLVVGLDVFVQAFARSPAARAYRLERWPLYVEEDLARLPDPVLWGSTHIDVFVHRRLADPAATGAPRP